MSVRIKLYCILAFAIVLQSFLWGVGTVGAQTSVSNSARVTAPPALFESNTANNTATATVAVRPLPSVAVSKSSNAGASVSVGQDILYTLSAVVTNATTLNALTLTDTVGPGLGNITVVSGGSFTCSGTQPFVCTLPAGRQPGTYSITYRATVLPSATGAVTNSVVPTGGDNPVCATPAGCTTSTPVTQTAVAVSKLGSTDTVEVGDTLTYTLRAVVSNSQTIQPVILTDTLGAGLTFGSVTSSDPRFVCTGGLVCTLQTGTAPGTYDVTYTASVNASAVNTVRNAVVVTGGNPNTECVGACEVTNPVAAQVVYTKSASTAGPVSVDDIITYQVTAIVSNASTSEVFTLTDTLGAGLQLGAVTVGSFTCNAANPLVCSLPVGTAPGTYTLTYSATVTAAATGIVRNAVVGTGSNPSCTGTCEITTPVDETQVEVTKTGTTGIVNVGDTLTYTLRAVVSNSRTLNPVILTDTMGTGLTFGSVTSSAPQFQCTGSLVCTLATGTAPGTYEVVYTAQVNALAVNSVRNNVLVSGGNPNTGCVGTCSVVNPVEANVAYSKSASPLGPVSVGDIITYQVTAVVSNATTTQLFTLTDTLGAGLEIGTVTAGSFNCGAAVNPLVCSLPVGTVPGTYTLSYTATVTADARTSVRNAVAGTGSNPRCSGTCEVTTPLADARVTYDKRVNGNAPSARVGDILSYTLRVVVENSSNLDAVTLSDTLGTGLTFNGVSSLGQFTCTPPVGAGTTLVCVLPASMEPGIYEVTYNALVNADATGSVRNSVLGSGNDNPSCVGSCSTVTTVLAPVVTYGKSVGPLAGPVVFDDLITYNLTVTVANSQTTAPVTLTDVPGTGLVFETFVSSDPELVCTNGASLQCVLAANSAPATYTATYTARVTDQATGSVVNQVTGSGPDNPQCAGVCSTSTPMGSPQVTYAKTSSTAGALITGDTIDYTLTVTVSDAMTMGEVVLTDTMSTGLSFRSITANSGGFVCDDASDGVNPVVCRLPAGQSVGTYSLTYRAEVLSTAIGAVTNAVVGSGADNPVCGAICTTSNNVTDPAVNYRKLAVNRPSSLKVGDLIEFELRVSVANALLREVLTLTDPPGAGFEFAGITANTGNFTCNATLPLVCTLPAGTATGVYDLRYELRVTTDALNVVTNSVTGSGGDNPTCTGICTIDIPVQAEVTYAKTADTAGPVRVGDIVTYTLTAEIEYADLTQVFTLTDTMGAGLDFGTVTNAGAFTCNATNPLICSLPVGTSVGTYALTYTATVNDQAVGSVRNAVVGTGDNPVCTSNCDVDIPVTDPSVTYAKTADTAGPVKVGDTITYTLSAEVTNSQLTQAFTLTDTMGTGLDFGTVTNAGAFTCNATNPLVCSLPVGTSVGTYALTHTATVNDQAVGSVLNAVVGTGDNPVCTSNCDVDIPVADPSIGLSKTVDVPAGQQVSSGDVLTYTVTALVSNSATAHDFTFVDTLGAGLDFGSVTNADVFTCNDANPLECVLPAGAAPGAYAVTYTATVSPTAVSEVRNAVVGRGDDDFSCEGPCEVVTPLVDPTIRLNKTSTQAPGTRVEVGQTLDYTLTVTVGGSALTHALTVTDTPGQGLIITTAQTNCTMQGREMVCVLPVGTAVGVHTFSYQALVDASANGRVSNVIVGTSDGATPPVCDTCVVEHEVDAGVVRLSKTAGVRDVKVGDLVRYTLTIENLTGPNLVNASVIDTPAAGFTYVEGSLQVVDGDNFGTVTGSAPIRFGGIDVESGQTATVSYLMRVGAGVRQGTHTNSAIVQAADGTDLSNRATAEVELGGDPLFDDSLLFGSVFHDRDGDGWQDAASLGGVTVQGGFAPEVYVTNSTTMDRGDGAAPVADASSPMLHGIQIGGLAGRQSETTAPATVVIRQRLTAPTFTNDFVLTNRQGVTVRMDAAGNTAVEKSGEAARGQNGAEPQVERRVTQEDGVYVVDYVVRNMGIDERGIPGVRIGTVEGLLIETDQFGRYHLTDIPGGDSARGRNFIMKVDPASLPQGAEFTTENPLVRRITPGVPVRFDWGVRFPTAEIPGGRREVELELGTVAFAAGSAQVSTEHSGLIDQMAQRVREYQGGEIVISANGESEALAFARASAVKDAVEAKLAPSERQNLKVTVRTRVEGGEANLVTLDGRKIRLGSVLFDTDSAALRPEHSELLDRIASEMARNLHREVTIVGNADVRGASSYNVELGLRRARAVSDALSSRLPNSVNARVTVEDVGLPASSGRTAGR